MAEAMHRLRIALLMLVLAGFPSSMRFPRAILGNRPDMAMTPVPLDPTNPAQRRAGALTYLGGVRLSSSDPAFGGFSEMTVVGDRFTLLSDAGNVVRFRMGPDWHPTELSFGDLPGGPGTGASKLDRDSESMTRDPATGKIWVGFEGANAIWRYDASLTHVEAGVAPAAMRDWDSNGGAESMVRLHDGGFIVIAETTRPPGSPRQHARIALRFTGDPTDKASRAFAFIYVPPEGYDPSDMTELPDGRLLVLNRRVTIREWFSARLVLLDPRAIRPGARVSGSEIATIAAPMTRDNFEALGVTQEGGATILWIATDDNLEPFEQSLLMKFRLDLPPQSAKP
jgi:hypothetical protein